MKCVFMSSLVISNKCTVYLILAERNYDDDEDTGGKSARIWGAAMSII